MRGARVIEIPVVSEARGRISMAEVESTLPFTAQRYFVVYDVPREQSRGEHAHRRCEQFLVCLRGSVVVTTDDGTGRQEFLLNSPAQGLHIPPMIWGIQSNFSADALLLVLASEKYDPAEYIRDYHEFLAALGPD
jgi:UDP-2-acetamido-3-amino-2,3-dideoxy-glucuronate N-acetyltransferase